MKVSLIIPAYNEAKRLGPFLESIARYVKQHSADIHEIIVVNDGSSDTTPNIARDFEKKIPSLKLRQLPTNTGKGAAVQAGVMQATGDYIIFMDADGATAITELPKMIAALEQAPIAIGNRWMPGASTTRHSSLRRLAGWAYRHSMRLFGLGAVDTMCGFKGYRRAIALELFRNLREKRWLFDTEIAYKARQREYVTKNFPIRWESKDGSKLSTRELLKSALAIWPLIRRLKQEKS